MERKISDIRFLPLYIAVVIAFFGCKREPVAEEPGTAAFNVSSFQQNVVRLDTLVFSNPVPSGGQVRFDLIGTPPQIKNGDIIFYPGNGSLYTRVLSSATVGSRIIFQVEKPVISEVFKSISIQDENSKNLLKSRIRIQPARWNKDTINLSDLFIYDGFWQTRILQVHFNSGKLSAISSLNQFSLAAQGSDPWFDRLGLSFRYSLDLNGSLTIKTGSAMDAQDSIRLDNAVYGPFLVNGFPIVYQVDTWLGFHIVTASDTVLTMNVSGITSGAYP